MKSFTELRKNLTKPAEHLPQVKIAITGDTSTQFLNQAVKAYGIEKGYQYTIYEAPYNQIDLQILTGRSELHQFNPEFTIIFQSPEKLHQKFAATPFHKKSNFYTNQISYIENYCSILSGKNQKVILLNFPERDDGIFGNYANKTPYSFLYQVRKLNTALMDLSQKYKNLFIADFNQIEQQNGTSHVHDSRMYYSADMAIKFDTLPLIAKTITDIISSVKGKIHKCVILDLDNTVWGGIIGEDGVENIKIGETGTGKIYKEFQQWLKQLRERGIILAACSKNDESTAIRPFRDHPDMVLQENDIAVFIANWHNKPDNIRYIKDILNINTDAMIFIDDSPFERDMVKNELPEITVPDMPENPEDFQAHLRSLNLFETASFSPGSKDRTQQYRQEAKREEVRIQYTNEADFLKSLKMQSEAFSFTDFAIPRLAELSQRSNQFNLRTVRYTEARLKEIANDKNFLTRAFRLSDKFGDYGIISMIILECRDDYCFINTWIMSCRVLNRSMEHFVLNDIARIIGHANKTFLKGEYIPTQKNALVKDLYANLGFTFQNEYWWLNVKEFTPKTTYIMHAD